MRTILTFVVIFINSTFSFPSDKNVKGFVLAMKFYNNYATDFLNSDLIKFNYHPRTQYDFLTDSNSYRVLVKDENNISIIGFIEFAKSFNLPLDTIVDYYWASLKCVNSLYILELGNNKFTDYQYLQEKIKKSIKTETKYEFTENVIDDNPLKFFNNLEKLRIKYGIINIKNIKAVGVVEIYFSSTDYLIYFPSDLIIDIKYQEYWDKKKKEGKKLDDNWYYYESDKPLDVG